MSVKYLDDGLNAAEVDVKPLLKTIAEVTWTALFTKDEDDRDP